MRQEYSSANDAAHIASKLDLQAVRHLIERKYGKYSLFVLERVCFGLTNGHHVAGLMLRQLLLWTPRTVDPDGWIYKSKADWQAELYLTRRDVDGAEARLESLGVQTTRRWRRKQRAPVKHYRLDPVLFLGKLIAFLEIAAEEGKCVDDVLTDESNGTKRAVTPDEELSETSNYTVSNGTDRTLTDTSNGTERAVSPGEELYTSYPSISTAKILSKTPEIPNNAKNHRHHQDDDDDDRNGIELEEIYQLYKELIGELTEPVKEALDLAAEAYSTEWIAKALRRGALYKPRDLNWPYIETILANWKLSGGDDEVSPDGLRYITGKYADFIDH